MTETDEGRTGAPDDSRFAPPPFDVDAEVAEVLRAKAIREADESLAEATFAAHALGRHEFAPDAECAECRLNREEAEAALTGAVAHLRTILRLHEDGAIEFAEYPRELVSFDELTLALANVVLR